MAKGADLLIGTSVFLEAIGSPKAILESKPGKEFASRRGPTAPYELVVVGGNGSQELSQVCKVIWSCKFAKNLSKVFTRSTETLSDLVL